MKILIVSSTQNADNINSYVKRNPLQRSLLHWLFLLIYDQKSQNRIWHEAMRFYLNMTHTIYRVLNLLEKKWTTYFLKMNEQFDMATESNSSNTYKKENIVFKNCHEIKYLLYLVLKKVILLWVCLKLWDIFSQVLTHQELILASVYPWYINIEHNRRKY